MLCVRMRGKDDDEGRGAEVVTEEVSAYLVAGGKLTAADAARLFGVFSFSSMMSRLRKRMAIKSAWRPNMTRAGRHKVYFV